MLSSRKAKVKEQSLNVMQANLLGPGQQRAPLAQGVLVELVNLFGQYNLS